MNLGIIAEDDSDVAVVREMTLKLLKPKSVGFKKFVGKGCGKLRRKCAAWAKNLVRQGCSGVVVVHDLDTYNPKELWEKLNAAVIPAKAKVSVVLIPKREIEAWLLYDGVAIAQAFGETSAPKLPGNPEDLPDPKEHLGELVWKKYRKQYLHTIHNPRIARSIDVKLMKKSLSFAPHFEFAATIMKLKIN